MRAIYEFSQSMHASIWLSGPISGVGVQRDGLLKTRKEKAGHFHIGGVLLKTGQRDFKCSYP